MTSLSELHIEETVNRPALYWFVDGIAETVVGGLWLLCSIGILGSELTLKIRGFGYLAASFVYSTVAIGLVMPFLLPRIIQRWKERVTYPRTGYIEPRKPSVAVRVAGIALVGLMAVGTVLLASSGSFLREWMPLAVSMVTSASLVRVAWKIRAARLAVLAPLIAVAALITTAMHVKVGMSYGVIWFVAAWVCLIDGLLTLRRYLKAHPEPVGAAL